MRWLWWLGSIAVVASIVASACGSSSNPAPSADADVLLETQGESSIASEPDTAAIVDSASVEVAEPTQPAVENGTSVATAPVSAPTPSEAAFVETAPGVPERSRDTEVKRLFVTIDGEDIFIKNGSEVLLGDGLAVEIFVDPYPPSTLRTWVDMYLTENGEPVTDASMGIEYDMLAMVHGPFWGEAADLGAGHYLFTLDYIMFGPWDQIVTIRRGMERVRLPLVLVAFP